ncbi:CoA-transferase family III [Punctularia strigosozonata HHB-11173 SS5]|uniref:CoA-transferase family III n=1 Tax=Punctularia strigosozonata (strain HHB-11173) TaxID=741275 RepID=R7S468_PUNST|nr:CoA-transferase family III [Punctularia strigosozonata HHB-11173 SS5]EIN04036.1 CoA-transferase family III [Punctularia strigosozonata HHB-11173 SS5]
MLPLDGIRVVEFAGLAPAPFAGLVLADWGADVIRIDRAGQATSTDVLCRGKRSFAANLKHTAGKNIVLKLISSADVLIDPFRPGVLERLGFAPEVFLGPEGINKRLIYSRIRGFPIGDTRQNSAGHDINYLAASGVLSMLPGTDKPMFPLNLLADFGGGGLLCALGIILALFQRQSTGVGQVVTTDMVSGTRYISSFPLLNTANMSSPWFSGSRGTNLLDGGAPFYDIYVCSDGGYISVGCLEPQFFTAFIDSLRSALPRDFSVGGWIPSLASLEDRSQWPQLREYIGTAFRAHTRDYWAGVFDATDSCVVPVLSPTEASAKLGSSIPLRHPCLSAAVNPPRSSHQSHATIAPGRHTHEVLMELGYSDADRRRLVLSGAVGGSSVGLNMNQTKL